MSRRAGWFARVIALALAAPLAACDAAPDGEAGDEDAVTSTPEALGAGEMFEWDHFEAGKGGVDPRFKDVKVDGKAKFWTSNDHDQKFRMGWDGQKGEQSGLVMLAKTIEAKPGQYFKGWLLGSVNDSTNQGIGFCGFGNVNGNLKAPFRSQLQMVFFDGKKRLAGCYCNLCPVNDGAMVSCATDQWHLDTGVSDDGACVAPKGTDRVAVQIEAVAKPPLGDVPAGEGTGLIRRFRFARCDNDGSCVSKTPGWYTN
jgi:hypothetical protein